ncbi:MAG: hypothetical protein ACRENN_00650, partial [Candidatus Eiseniibacteriota bacterium]
MGWDRDPLADMEATTTRRGFLRICGTAAAGLISAGTLLAPARRADAAAPAWSAVPAQVWSVGVPVHLDLAPYCTDADGDPLAFSLNRALPPGVTLAGSVISGTPTGSFATTTFIAT